MPKRFTATEKWVDPWFCSLSQQDKLFWIYLLDNCNHAGIWQVNWPLVYFYIPGFKFEESVFNGRINFISKDKWFIPKFIDFQYGVLNPENRANKSVIDILEKEGAYKVLTRSLQGRKDKDKDKVKDKDIYIQEFVDYWNLKADIQKIVSLGDQRKSKIKARFSKAFFRDNWKKAIDKMCESDFLTGKVFQEGKKPFRANIDWFIRTDEQIAMVMEGKYDNQKTGGKKPWDL